MAIQESLIIPENTERDYLNIFKDAGHVLLDRRRDPEVDQLEHSIHEQKIGWLQIRMNNL